MKKEESIPFRPFNPRGDIRVYKHGFLPHWRQDGCTYLVTFRLADSLPASITNQLKEDRKIWLRKNNIDPEADNWRDQFSRLPESLQREYEKQIGQTLNVQLDRGYGSCVLKDPGVSEIIARALEFHDPERLHTGNYVVMPNHVHALMSPANDHEVEDVLQSIKVFWPGKLTSSSIRLAKPFGNAEATIT